MEIILILIFLFVVGGLFGGSSSSSNSSSGKITEDKDLQNFLDYEAAEHILNPDKTDNFFHF